jgi:hypothetical protein
LISFFRRGVGRCVREKVPLFLAHSEGEKGNCKGNLKWDAQLDVLTAFPLGLPQTSLLPFASCLDCPAQSNREPLTEGNGPPLSITPVANSHVEKSLILTSIKLYVT